MAQHTVVFYEILRDSHGGTKNMEDTEYIKIFNSAGFF